MRKRDTGGGAPPPTPPVLSAASALDFSDVFVWGQATTDTASGILYAVVVPGAASTPSAAQIVAGTNAAGVAAPSANVAVASSGVKQVLVRGLTAATAYKICMTHQAAGSNSNVVTGSFTTDTLVLAFYTDGTTTGVTGATTGSAALTAVADPHGGTNALRWTDSNDSATGGVVQTLNIATFFNGQNKIHITIKYVSGAQWMRITPAQLTVNPYVNFNVADGTIGVETYLGTPVTFDMGNGWRMFSGIADLTGADVTGNMAIAMGMSDNLTSTVVRNGTNIRDLYNWRITRV